MRRPHLFLILVLSLVVLTPAATVQSASKNIATESGYSMLRLFLVDEHYLTAIRRVKSVLSFGGISPDTAGLVDEIAIASETALNQLEILAKESPAIQFDTFDESNIAITTFDALRFSMARQLFLDSTHFEKNLLLSQIQILPVITHLIKQLEANETNKERKKWLHNLAEQYAGFYRRSQDFFVLSVNKN